MKLYIGGRYQGKREYALRQNPGMENCLVDEFQEWVRELTQNHKNAEQEVANYLSLHPDAIIICEEIGNGIVPMDKFEREYRECLGKILIQIAEKAEEVVRVICGIGQRIK